MWLDGYERVTWPHSAGFASKPMRAVCFHTTEGFEAEHAFGVYANSPSCPHLTIDPEERTIYQHVPLDLSAYALRNLPGGCETNSTGVVQIEMVGFAKDTWAWSSERLRWIGEAVLAPILAACPTIPHLIYNGPRMTCVQWDAWIGGLCGHDKCPENDHWDPGDLDYAAILTAATDLLDPPETDMILLKVVDDPSYPDGYYLEMSGNGISWVRSANALAVYIAAKVPEVQVTSQAVTEILWTKPGVGPSPSTASPATLVGW